jgi:hypothetical protein
MSGLLRDQILPAVVVAFGTLIPLLTAWLAVALRSRLGVDVTVKQWEMWNAVAVDAVAFAEQMAHAEDMSGERKMQLALSFVDRAAAQHNLANLAREHVQQLIEAQLGKLRTPAPK